MERSPTRLAKVPKSSGKACIAKDIRQWSYFAEDEDICYYWPIISDLWASLATEKIRFGRLDRGEALRFYTQNLILVFLAAQRILS